MRGARYATAPASTTDCASSGECFAMSFRAEAVMRLRVISGSWMHSTKSGTELTAHERFAEPKMEEVLVVEPNKKDMGKAFKKDVKAVTDALAALCAVGMQATGAWVGGSKGSYSE